MKTRITAWLTALFLGITLLGAPAMQPSASAQCPMCRLSVESSMKDKDTAHGMGLNEGILYLLVAPYILVGGVAGYFYVNYRKKKRRYPELY
jgi:hypothetical protein